MLALDGTDALAGFCVRTGAGVYENGAAICRTILEKMAYYLGPNSNSIAGTLPEKNNKDIALS